MNEHRGLWRGKHVDNGKWVNGLLAYRDYELSSAQLYNENDCEEFWVDPSTLGECTGLTDKNGKLIFEGDILKHQSGTLHEVVFEQRNGKAYFGWKISEIDTWDFDLEFLRQLEVVGNVHDNPELLRRATGEDIGNAAQDTIAPAT